MIDSALTTPPVEAPPRAPSSVRRQLLQGILIAAAALPLIVGCWDASFLSYDDSDHVFANPRLASSAAEIMSSSPGRTYFPVTEFSYQVDRVLFSHTLPHYFNSWAPGVRFMTLLYHTGAALMLWRVLRLLKFSEAAAFFIAVIFAGHPLACETVCWISERKNALAGLFGFAALWAWLRWDGHLVRMPLTFLFYMLALFSKPSALGLLPVFGFLEAFNVPAGLQRGGTMYWRPSKAWLTIFERLVPLVAIALISLKMNLKGFSVTIQPPPGGTVFTALLTDLEILSRYLYNIVLPIHLSAVYYVEPIRSISDPRVAGYGLLLLSVVAVTIWLAARRRYAVFGWLWFLGALGPNLNIISLPHLMQDRYIYLSSAGVLLVLVETIQGILARLRAPGFELPSQKRVLRAAGVTYFVMIAALSISRGTTWGSTLLLFKDAVDKQPQACFAHYGLGSAYAQVWQMTEKQDPKRSEEFRSRYLEEWRRGIDCPDAPRYACFYTMALNVGEEFNRRGNLPLAEKYWTIGAAPPVETFDDPVNRAPCLGYLAAIRFSQGRLDEAYAKVDESVKVLYLDTTLLLRARIELAIAESKLKAGEAAPELIEKARKDLLAIAPESRVIEDARKLLEHPLLKKSN